MRRAVRSVTVMACAAAATLACFGCSTLLDLDVQYADTGDAAVAADVDAGLPRGTDATATADHDTGTGPDADATGFPGTDGIVPPGEGGSPEPDAQPLPEASLNPPEAGTQPPRWIQDQFAETMNGALSLHVTLPGAVTASDTIIVGVEYSSDASLVISDTLGTPFSRAGAVAKMSNGVRSELWYAIGVPGGTETVTLTFPGITIVDFIAGYVHEYAGISAFEQSATASSESTTAMASGNITTTVPNELLFGFGTTTIASPATGFTPRRTDLSDLTEDRIVPTPTTTQALATSAGAPWAMIGAAFKP